MGTGVPIYLIFYDLGYGLFDFRDIAAVAQSESKWKQLGELAMSSGMTSLSGTLQIEMAEECLKHANDLSGLLLLYSSLGDAEEILKLASLAKDHGKNNVAFLCLFMLGKLEECLQLLDSCLDCRSSRTLQNGAWSINWRHQSLPGWHCFKG
ncbi:hypothetical protein RJ640_023049 [Escallonia rubra]|uniref:COPA/B TPR domain-containing protein n=1 Tax=Escallonia rubra TaxID=112253 RepID=A0AA88S7E2_9ASTE|nr:hypothetical protein RJ640_023049 [Escallonia rubra]